MSTALCRASVATIDECRATVEWDDGWATSFDVLWLRDNCPTGGDKRSAIRSFSVADVAPGLKLTAVRADGPDELYVEFSDGHTSVFDAGWLRASAAPRTGGDVVCWRTDVDLPELAYRDRDNLGAHRDLLEALVSHGAAVVRDVPTDPAGSEALAALLGPVRETDFGRFFDIVSEPRVWEMSQSTAALDPHTDDPYRYTPSGVSVLHCIEASSGGGGRSTLVDGFAVAATIRAEQPEAFDLLTSVAVPWVRYQRDEVDQGGAVDLRADAPVIRIDGDGEVSGIRFHERSLGTLSLDPDVTGAWYRALIEFVNRIRDEEFQWTHHLAPGEALVFDNQRVLHGRTGFTGETGRRHLRLCTVDRENVHSRLRLLRERDGTPGADDKLPAGNLA
ncbi:MAG: TauD/TfdA family dioxygenase [Ilumatobacteraceae bacterium]